MGEWRRVQLGELAEIYDGPHATPRKVASGALFLGISNLAQGRLDLSETEHLSDDDFAKWTRRVTPRAGDVVFSYETRLGEAALIPHGLRACLGRRMGLLRAREGMDSRFLLYAYLGPAFQETLRQRTVHGSTVDRIPLIDMGSFPIEVPALPTQRAIARILGTLDDKIELNRKTNETLEAMARALFKSWFVDFDPVRDKAEGRTPSGMDAETAKLFPSEFVDSELGPIPKGWCVHALRETSKLVMGQSPPGDTYNTLGNGIPFFQGSTDFGFRFPSRRVFCSSPTRFATAGDTLVSVRAPVGTLNMAVEACAVGRGIASIRHRSDSRSFTYYLLHSMQAAFEPYDAEGTVFGSINKAAFEGLRHLEPPPLAVEAFTRRANLLDDRIELLTKENAALVLTRNELLPRLLSGELSVADTEKKHGHA